MSRPKVAPRVHAELIRTCSRCCPASLQQRAGWLIFGASFMPFPRGQRSIATSEEMRVPCCKERPLFVEITGRFGKRCALSATRAGVATRCYFVPLLLRAENAIACIAQSRENVTMLVEFAIDVRGGDRQFGMVIVEMLEAFGLRQQTNDLDAAR